MKRLTNERGGGLVEVMVAIVILTIAGLGVLSATAQLARAIVLTRSISLSANLVQERIASLKDKSYFEVLPTPTASYLTQFTPPVPYDTVYYPPEEVVIGKGRYTRYTYVERMEADPSGNLIHVAHNGLDTGIKRITVTAVWTAGQKAKKASVSNLISNTSLARNAGFSGTVTSTLGGGVEGARIYSTNNPFFSGTSSSDGTYAFSVTPGSYALRAVKAGYHPSVVSASLELGQGNFGNLDFSLIPLSSGSVAGTVWINSGLVLSQILGSTTTAGLDEEYVEVYNPTTYTWTMAGGIGLRFQRSSGGFPGSDPAKIDIDIDFIRTSIPPGGYFLFANTGTVHVLGRSISADAVWDRTLAGPNDIDFYYFDAGAGDYNILPINSDGPEGEGALELYRISDGLVLDRFGWTGNGCPHYPGFYETAPFPDCSGLQSQEQYFRYSSTDGYSAVYGPAYDSDNNSLDWGTANPLTVAPSNSLSAPKAVIAGKPAVGALVTSDDGLSSSTEAYRITSGGRDHAYFELTGVATGTWTIEIATRGYALSIESVVVSTAGAVVEAFIGDYMALGTVTGSVTDTFLNPISGITVDVHPAGTGVTDENGIYRIAAAPDTYDVTANPNGDNTGYTNATVNLVSVSAGQVTSAVDFVLSGAGTLSGYVCNAEVANVYPGVIIGAYDGSDNLVAEAVTGADGRFRIPGLPLGTYSLKPILDDRQATSPVSLTLATVAGSDLFIGTYTITGAFGTITGEVAVGGVRVKTGVLIIATTGTISGVLPPAISTDVLSGVPYYMGSSQADGTYRISVRTSSAATNINVYAWHTIFSGETPVTTKISASAAVTGGQTTELDLSWP